MSSSVEIRWLKATMNSVNGAGVEHWYFNASEKEIKYLTFAYMPYNQVGDQVKCTVSGKSVVSCQLTGPIKPYCENRVQWQALWYNSTVTEIKLVQIHVEYMDGTEETIDGDDVMDMSNKQSVYYEKVQKPEEIKRAEREKQREIEYAEWKKKEDAKKRKEELMQAYKCYKVLSCISKTKDDEEMKLHVNQGIWLFIIEILAVILLFIVPKVGPFICLALIIVAVVFSNIGIKAVKENKSFELPILGKVKLFK